jgi:mannan endo-1,4-beta-mannosidase
MSNGTGSDGGERSPKGGVGRRAFLGSLAGAAGIGGATRAAKASTDHRIVVRTSGDRSDYEFTVTDSVREGWSMEDGDGVDGRTASGTVYGQWSDDYFYAGEIDSFASDDDVVIEIDGERVDPSKLGGESDGSNGSTTHHIYVDGRSDRTTYEFTVTDSVHEGWSMEDGDGVDGRTASGTVYGGWSDDYFYTGSVSAFTMDGDAEVRIDGETVDPSTLGSDSGSTGSSTDSTEFVDTDGDQFSLGGDRVPMRGTNSFFLSYTYWDRSAVDEVLDAAADMGLNSIRTWAFGDGNRHLFRPAPGSYNETAFERLDYVVKAANERDINLVLALSNYWPDFGGMDQYVSWSDTADSRTDFYTDETCKRLYREYVEYVLTRENSLTGTQYRNDDTIVMWELANELRNPDAPDRDGSTLNAWVDEMAGFVKSVDPNHLVSTGAEGWAFDQGSKYDDVGYWMNTQGYDFVELHQSKHVDAGSIHLYPDHWDISVESAAQFIGDRAREASEELNKPMYVGEFGLGVDFDAPDADEQLAARNSAYQTWYDAMADTGVDGSYVWQLVPEEGEDAADQFGMFYPEHASTVETVRVGSKKL